MSENQPSANVPPTGPMVENCPELPGDAERYGKGERPMIPRVRMERRIVWNLLKALAAKGFVPFSVDTGEGTESARDAVTMMEHAFSVDDCTLIFQHSAEKTGRTYWVRIVGGNGVDIVSDYGIPAKDPHGFAATLDSFDPEAFA